MSSFKEGPVRKFSAPEGVRTVALLLGSAGGWVATGGAGGTLSVG